MKRLTLTNKLMNNLRKMTTSNNYTEISEIIGISANILRNWDRKKSAPSLKQLTLIAQKLNTEVILILVENRVCSLPYNNDSQQLFRNNLTELKERRDLSYQNLKIRSELGENVPQYITLYQYINGKRSPNLDQIEKLAVQLNIDPILFFVPAYLKKYFR